MSHQLISSIMSVKTGSPISKLILLKLAHNADSYNLCFPSCHYLALHCEISLRTVKSHLSTLEKNGFITRIQRFNEKGRQRSNLYQLRIPENCHIEQCNSYTREGDHLAPTEGDQTAHINDQKEKDLQEGCNSSSSHSQIHQTAQAVICLLTKEGEWAVSTEFYQQLQQNYPNINVLEQLRAMQTWLLVNEEKRKPMERIKHFIYHWLTRRQEADLKRKNYLAQNSRSSEPCRGVDKIVEEYRQSGKKHPLEERIHNMLKKHKAKR
ncbi:MAG: helix-turn-helix domain-containing protein [Vibrio sp.]|uniref:helix-turn-helix domain-containing protein n=1 Tax=Vibrio sp. TaxID=678 RepID=UPI003A8672EB